MSITIRQLDHLVGLKIQAEAAAETYREALKHIAQTEHIRAASLRTVVAAMTKGGETELEESAEQVLGLLRLGPERPDMVEGREKAKVLLHD